MVMIMRRPIPYKPALAFMAFGLAAGMLRGGTEAFACALALGAGIGMVYMKFLRGSD